MMIRYVPTFENKYIQARCMAQNFTTDVTQWQGVDDEPISGSDNLVKSGGIIQSISNATSRLDYILTTKINGYLRNDGEIVYNSSMESEMCWLLPVNSSELIYIDGYYFGNAAVLCFYDETKTFISFSNNTHNNICVPENAKYVSLCGITNTGTEIKSSPVFYFVKPEIKSLCDLENNIQQKDTIYNLNNYNKNIFMFDLLYGYLNTNGTLSFVSGFTGYASGGYEYIKGTDYIFVDCYVYGNAASACFYDENYTLISYSTTLFGKVEVPSNAYYARFGGIYISDDSVVHYKPTVFVLDGLLNNKVIYLFGDSISGDAYRWYARYLALYTGANVIRGGHGGYDSHSLATLSIINEIESYNADYIVCLMGANDTGELNQVGTFGTRGGMLSLCPTVSIPDVDAEYSGWRYIENIAYIALQINKKYCRFRDNIGVTLSNEYVYDDTRKPKMLFCTPFGEKRYTDESVLNNTFILDESFSNPTNHLRKAEAVREMCNVLNIPLVDLANDMNLDLNNETAHGWTGSIVTDINHNGGNLLMDGLHPNKYGSERMARIVANKILSI